MIITFLIDCIYYLIILSVCGGVIKSYLQTALNDYVKYLNKKKYVFQNVAIIVAARS